jgi:hypothetical protein
MSASVTFASTARPTVAVARRAPAARRTAALRPTPAATLAPKVRTNTHRSSPLRPGE